MKQQQHFEDGVPGVVFDTGVLKQGLPPPPGARDVPFAFIWILNVVAFIVLTAYGGHKYSERHNAHVMGELDDAGILDHPGVIGKIFAATLCAAFASLFFSGFWLWMASRFPRQLIIFTIVANVMIYIISAGVYVVLILQSNVKDQSFVPAVVLVLVGLLHGCLYFLWRRRIPFAAALLSTVAQVTRAFPGTMVTSYCSLFALLAWLSLYCYGAVVTMSWVPEGGAAYGIAVYLLFTFYWSQQVIKNVAHVTNCGVFATWYFMGGNNNAIPANPTLGAFKRACTTSFGSICFGSMLVAILQTLRAIVRGMRSKRNAILVCIIDCILACLEQLIRRFNHYAFSICAIYGDSFCEAAEKTFQLLGSHGITAIINDSILRNVLSFGCFFGGIACGGVGAVCGYLFIVDVPNGAYLFLIPAILGFFLGVVSVSQVMTCIDSGIATVFVSYALDPAQLAHNDVVLAQQFEQASNLI